MLLSGVASVHGRAEYQQLYREQLRVEVILRKLLTTLYIVDVDVVVVVETSCCCC